MKIIYVIALVLFTSNAYAAADRVLFGEVKVLQGAAKSGEDNLAVNKKVFVGDTITTEKQSFVRIRLADGSGAFQIGPASSVKLVLSENTVSTLDLLQGYVLSTLKPAAKPSEQLRYQVRTRTVSMGVRGTTFFARAEKGNRTYQCICEGKVESTWKNGQAAWESKHHETRHIFTPEKAERASLNLPANHTDQEIAELKKLL